MKRLEVKLDEAEQKRLEALRRKYDDYRSERALAILHCAEGMSARKIAAVLLRTEQTVRSWLASYMKEGIAGLSRTYSSGRPSLRAAKFTPRMEEYLSKSPTDYGWGEETWSIKVLIAQYEKETGVKISEDSVERALKDADYSFKRAKLKTPDNSPSKEEKLEKVREIAAEIIELKATKELEVVFLDESHFSTEPYVARGWHKRGKPFFPGDSEKEKGLHNIWRVRTGETVFLLEKFEPGQRRKLQAVPSSTSGSRRRKTSCRGA